MTFSDHSHISFRKRAKCFVLLALICLAGVFQHSLWSNDAREGAMIAEMLRENRWVTPSINGAPYFEKPPLLHWTAMIFCRIAGRTTEGLLRLPSSLYGFGALILMVSFARAMQRERAGWAGAFMCATAVLFLEYSRVVLTDSAITFMVILSLRLFWAAWISPEPARAKYALFLIVSALSFYTKGLLGPGLVWVSVCFFLAAQRAWKKLFTLPVLFLPIFLFAILPWVLALINAGGASYIKEVFWANQFGRFLTLHDPNLPLDPYFVHKQPVWFYMLRLPARLLPWSLFVLAAMIHWFRAASPVRGQLPTFLRAALVSMLLVLHASSAKAAPYAMPLFPILFIMTGVWYENALVAGPDRITRFIVATVLSILGLACLLAPLALLAGVAALPFGFKIFWLPGPFTAAATAIIALIALFFALFMIRENYRGFAGNKEPQAILNAPMAFGVMMALLITAATPAYDFQRTYLPAAAMAGNEIASGRSLALVSELERDHGQFLFYLNTRLARLSPADDLKSFLVDSPGQRGLIVPKQHQEKVRTALRGLPIQTIACAHQGYKSADFLVFLDQSPQNQLP